jgi:hypothetical protein
LLSRYQQDDAKYAEVVANLPIDNALKYESGFALFKHKNVDFPICFNRSYDLVFQRKFILDSVD